jgi:alpha-amylase
MVVHMALYTLVHQPRRLKLPAQPVPRGASLEDIAHCLFDERLNERCFRQVALSCYYPAARLFLELVRQQKLRLTLGFTLSFVQQAQRWEPALLDLFRELVAEEGVELVGADPYHSVHCLIDLPGFSRRMCWMADELARLFGQRPTVTDTAAMGMSAGVYHALDAAGFRGAFAESSTRVLQWRSSNYLYRYDHELPASQIAWLPCTRRDGAQPGALGPCLLVPHQELSDDVGLRFSNPAWPGYPLYADVYARRVAQTRGDLILLRWDFETFGGHHTDTSGIFEFLRALPGELQRDGVSIHTAGELIDSHADERVYHLPLPAQPVTFADSYGLDSISGYGPQRELFQLMRDIYDLARLTENSTVLDLASWLMQLDHLHLLHWPGPQFAEAVTPREWWRLGVSGLLRERRQVYLNALEAFEPYLPTRMMRRRSQISPARAAARQIVVEQQAVEVPLDAVPSQMG